MEENSLADQINIRSSTRVEYRDNQTNESISSNKLHVVSIVFSSVSLAICLSLVIFIFGLNGGIDYSIPQGKSSSLFQEPDDLELLIQKVSSSTVTVYCADYSGSGWAIDLADDNKSAEDDKYPVEIVTNYHVIEACIDSGEPITIDSPNLGQEYIAKLWNYDASFYDQSSDGWSDLAVLMTAAKVPALETASQAPKPGQWVMAMGSPGSDITADVLPNSVTFGRVSGYFPDVKLVVTDAAVNHGNSGGPLVNSWGKVMGTNTWTNDKETSDGIAYAIGVPTLCDKLVNCDGKKYLTW